MKKLFFVSAITITLVFLPSFVLAQNDQQGQGVQQKVQDPTTHEDGEVVVSQGNQGQNVNQIQTQNAGLDNQLQVANQELEQLTNLGGLEEIVGNQVKQLVGQQKQAQSETNVQLDKLESRQGLMKSLFGPDYKAIKNLNQLVEQNQLRIKQLQQLQIQVENQADQDQIQEAVQALVVQNTALQDKIQAEEQVSSLFGWLIKLFN